MLIFIFFFVLLPTLSFLSLVFIAFLFRFNSLISLFIFSIRMFVCLIVISFKLLFLSVFLFYFSFFLFIFRLFDFVLLSFQILYIFFFRYFVFCILVSISIRFTFRNEAAQKSIKHKCAFIENYSWLLLLVSFFLSFLCTNHCRMSTFTKCIYAVLNSFDKAANFNINFCIEWSTRLHFDSFERRSTIFFLFLRSPIILYIFSFCVSRNNQLLWTLCARALRIYSHFLVNELPTNDSESQDSIIAAYEKNKNRMNNNKIKRNKREEEIKTAKKRNVHTRNEEEMKGEKNNENKQI